MKAISPSWKGKTRGGILGYRIFVFTLQNFGLGSAYFLLRFVVAYFLIFAPKATAYSYKYFRNIVKLTKWKSFISVYRSFYIFGQTLIDKVAIRSGLQHKFDYSFDGRENLRQLQNTGGIVVSAHLGNWEIAGYLLDKINLKTNILMFEAEHEKIRGYLKKVITEGKIDVIPIKQDMSHIFKINNALKNKEVICMHADRFIEGSRVLQKKFMGKDAYFPLGPFAIISKLKAPYSFAFAVRGKKDEYFLSSTEIKSNTENPEIILDNYVKYLEQKLKSNPLQWFNYYDFWSKDARGAVIH